MVTPGTLSGSPADSQAVRARSRACGPTWLTHDDVLDGGRVDAGALHDFLENVGPQVRRVRTGERTLPDSDGGADCANDVCLGHEVLQGGL